MDPDKKHWSLPHTDGTLKKILKVFEGEKIHLDPALRTGLSNAVIASPDKIGTKQSQIIQIPSLEKRGAGRFSDNEYPFIPSPLAGEGGGEGGFEDLRRELASRKYSYRTVKGYLYYNRDFLGFAKKMPSEITDNNIKDYLLYLAEEKQSASSTLNQAINALKFYYGAMLKRKFIYEVKRPRKDKKLPVVLSKDAVAKIISSVDNVKHKAILMLIYSAGFEGRRGGKIKA